MPAKEKRFTRELFPRKRPDRRQTFSWGSVSLYNSTPPKVAIVVSKKTLSFAHQRNRVRRRIYSAFDKTDPGKYSAVVFPRREALTTKFETILTDLRSLA